MSPRITASALALLASLAFSTYAQTPAAPTAPAPAPAPVPAAPPTAAPKAEAPASAAETGLAAVYSDKLHGRRTASGEIYDRNKLTSAHKTLPFGTKVKITHAQNGKSVVVRINDRGPTQAGRVLDISPAAAKALGISTRGMAEVRVEVVEAAPEKAKKS